MPVYSFENATPVIHPSSYVHPQAVIIGDVWIAEHCYIGPTASIRGDFGRIQIGSGSNVQDNCVVHGFPDFVTTLGKNVHVGHGAVIHTATVHDDVLIGIKAVVLDYAVIGERAIIAANSLVSVSEKVPPATLFAGSPGVVKRELTADQIEAKWRGTQCYQELAKRSLAGLQLAQPLAEDDPNRKAIDWQLTFNARFQTQ